MRSHPLIVLKFGGSALPDAPALREVVHEIYRWRREGWRVLAVVSALAGRTDALGAVGAGVSDRLSPDVEAGVRALGEVEAAALLGAYLDRAGVPASVLHPAAIGLRADGDALDASPRGVDAAAVERALDRDGVVVVPGYIGCDLGGRTVTLGRGGSDLTALFLADALGADRCRLVKEVDGLYDRDPSLPGARRYGAASHADALATDGSIVQHKAVRFAAERGLVFEIGCVNGVRPTVVCAGPSRFEASARGEALTVALLGLGTVGGGVAAHLARLPHSFRVTGGAVRDASGRDEAFPVTTDAVGLASSGVDIVVEAMGGVDLAYRAVVAALEAGADVVTANKALVAAHGGALLERARANGRRLLSSASVGGSAPVVERAWAAPTVGVRGVLNGTANFVLERIAAGDTEGDALRAAQRAGLAEANPSRDLDGRDALDKLRVLALATGLPIETAHRDCESKPAPLGVIRQVASLRDGVVSVVIEEVRPPDPLWTLPDEWNCAAIERADGSVEVVRGRGAGRWPTAESVLADLLELRREREAGSAASHAAQGALEGVDG